MRAKLAIVVTLAVLVVLVIVVWMQTGTTVEVAAVRTSDEARSTPGDDPVAAQLAVSTSGAVEPAPARTSALSRTETAPTSEKSSPVELADATLVIRCRAKPSGKALEGIRVVAHAKDERYSSQYKNVSSSHGSLHTAPISDKSGEVELAVPSGVELEIRTKRIGNDVPAARQDVPALASAERRVTDLAIPTGDDVTFHGLVVSREKLEPIAGARVVVVVGPSWTAGSSSRDHARIDDAIVTGADGKFEVSASSWKNPYLRIESEGYGAAFVSFDDQHSDEEHALTIGLEREAIIEATVVDGRGLPVRDIVVRVTASGSDLTQPRRSYLALTDPAVAATAEWTGSTAVDGRCTLRGVAPAVELKLTLLRDRKTILTYDDRLRLNAGQTWPVRLELEGGRAISGILLDEQSTPVADQSIWLARATENDSGAHYFIDDYEVKAKTITDAAGRFAFAHVRPGAWWVGPAARADDEKTPSANALVPLAQRVDVLEGSASTEMTLTAHRGLVVRGRVLDADDRPAKARTVIARMSREEIERTSTRGRSLREEIARASTGADGTFTLGPLLPGQVELTATGSTDLRSEPTSVAVGDEHVILRVRAAAKLQGKVLDAVARSGCGARVRIQASERFMFGEAESDSSDGSFTIYRLEPGRYDLIARAGDGRMGTQRDIEVSANGPTVGLEVLVEPPARLRLRYDGASEQAWVRVTSAGLFIDNVNLKRGIFSETNAPSGSITLEFYRAVEPQPQRRELELTSRETREIVFTDAR